MSLKTGGLEPIVLYIIILLITIVFARGMGTRGCESLNNYMLSGFVISLIVFGMWVQRYVFQHREG